MYSYYSLTESFTFRSLFIRALITKTNYIIHFFILHLFTIYTFEKKNYEKLLLIIYRVARRRLIFILFYLEIEDKMRFKTRFLINHQNNIKTKIVKKITSCQDY